VSLGGYKIYGKIDRIDHSPDGSLHIIDYKTGKAKETLTAEDKRQLLLYERAARILPEYRNIGNTKTLTYYYLNDNVELSFESTPADHKKFEEKMVAILDELHATDFHNIGKKDMCGRCVACSVAGSAPI